MLASRPAPSWNGRSLRRVPRERVLDGPRDMQPPGGLSSDLENDRLRSLCPCGTSKGSAGSHSSERSKPDPRRSTGAPLRHPVPGRPAATLARLNRAHLFTMIGFELRHGGVRSLTPSQRARAPVAPLLFQARPCQARPTRLCQTGEASLPGSLRGPPGVSASPPRPPLSPRGRRSRYPVGTPQRSVEPCRLRALQRAEGRTFLLVGWPPDHGEETPRAPGDQRPRDGPLGSEGPITYALHDCNRDPRV